MKKALLKCKCSIGSTTKSRNIKCCNLNEQMASTLFVVFKKNANLKNKLKSAPKAWIAVFQMQRDDIRSTEICDFSVVSLTTKLFNPKLSYHPL